MQASASNAREGIGSNVVGQAPSVVSCRICGAERKQLGRHLRAAHDISPANYLARFPGALTDAPASRSRSQDCRRKQAAAASKRWGSAQERKAQSERMKLSAPWTGKSLTDEHRDAISRGCTGKTKVRRESTDGFSPRRYRTHGGRARGGRRPDIPHACRSLMEANFARVLLREGVPYEYRPSVVGLDWVPSFRLLRPLWELVPSGWVEVVGWSRRTGFLPKSLATRLAQFEGQTGTKVSTVCLNSTLWRAMEGIYSPLIPQWERRGVDPDVRRT